MSENIVNLELNKLTPPMNVTVIRDVDGLYKLDDFFKREKEIGFDYESNVVENFTYRRPRTMQFGNKLEQYVIDLRDFAQRGGTTLMDGLGWYKADKAFAPVLEVVQPVLESTQWLKVGHGLAFEYEVSKFAFGMRIYGLYCTKTVEGLILAGYVHPKSSDHFSLEGAVRHNLGFQIDKTLQTSFDLHTPLTHDQILYAAFDTRIVFPLRFKQLHTVQQSKLGRVAQIENDCIGSFVDIKLNGIHCAPEKWLPLLDEAKAEHRKTVAELDSFFIPVVGRKQNLLAPTEEEVSYLEENMRRWGIATEDEKNARREEKKFLRVQREELKRNFKAAWSASRKRVKEVAKNEKLCTTYEGEAAINYASNQQLLAGLLQMKGFTEDNLTGTDDDQLAKHGKKPVIAALRRYRKTKKKIDSYGEAWVTCYPDTPEGKPSKDNGFVNPRTGRIHLDIDPMATETGRTSCTNPNGQNLPKDKRYRAAFTAQGGHKVSTVDMSGAELRIIAEDSGAKVWIDAFNKKWDVHSVGTELLYGERWKSLTLTGCAYYTNDHRKCNCPGHLEMRDNNKAVNFQIAYGGTEYALAEELDITVDEARELLALHQRTFPDIWNYLDDSGAYARKHFENRTLFGRRRGFLRPTTTRCEQLLLKDKEEVNDRNITKKKMRMMGAIERAGKNCRVQGTNADIIKLAMGAGHDKDGKPFLWHTLEPELHAKLTNMVHDELVAEHEDIGEAALHTIGDAFRRAAAEVFTKIEMDYEGHVADYWRK